MTAKNKFIKPLFIILFLAFILVSFYAGMLSKEVKYLKNNLNQSADETSQNTSDGPLNNPNLAGPGPEDHLRGNPQAQFALIEYSDFDCSYCKSFHETAKQFIEQTDGETMWIFRQLPIVSLHPNAKTKAIASECAARQGGDATFWSYADELYDKGGEIALNTNELEKLLEGIAGDNQLDTTKFKRCLLNKETIGKVNNDIETSKTAKATGTPATYLMNLNTGQTLALNGAVSLQVLLNTLQILK